MLSTKEKEIVIKTIADKSRYKILEILIKNGGNLCVNEIAKNVTITPSAVSHQLAKLEANTIVKPIRKGQNICYRLCGNQVSQVIVEIIEMLNRK